MNEAEFRKRTIGLTTYSKEYEDLLNQFLKDQDKDYRKSQYKERLCLRVWKLMHPCLQVIHLDLRSLNEEQLLKIGKIARELHDEMDKAGLFKRPLK